MTYRIAEQLRRGMLAARSMQISGTELGIADIPVSLTFPGGASGRIRYLVLIELRDPVSGELVPSMQEIFTDVPVPRSVLLQEASHRAFTRQGRQSPPNIDPIERSMTVERAVIILVTRGA